MFPYRLAAIDLDETLLGKDHSVSERNAAAIERLRQAGVRCVIASGRMHESTTQFAARLGLREPIISYNGAMVRDTASGETWSHTPVPAELAARVVHFCADHGLHLNFYADDKVYVAERGRWADFYLAHTGSPMVVIGDLRVMADRAPTKLILIDAGETTHRLRGYFRSLFGSALYITTTNEEYLEFMNPAANKGGALEMVAGRLGIARDAVMAFGDGHNDVEMVRWAGFGVAMAHARPEVLDVADAVAPPCPETGLGAFVEDLLDQYR